MSIPNIVIKLIGSDESTHRLAKYWLSLSDKNVKADGHYCRIFWVKNKIPLLVDLECHEQDVASGDASLYLDGDPELLRVSYDKASHPVCYDSQDLPFILESIMIDIVKKKTHNRCHGYPKQVKYCSLPILEDYF